MNNTVKRLLCAALAALLCLSFAACSLQEEEEPFATVNGTAIADDDFDYLYDYYVSMFSAYGYDITSDAEYLESFKSDLLDTLIQEEVILQKAVELGYREETDELLAEAEEDFETTYEEYLDYYYYDLAVEELGEDATEEELRARMDEMFEEEAAEIGESYQTTHDDYIQSFLDNSAYQALRDSVVSTVTVEEDEVQAYYDEQLEAQTEEITETPYYYEYYAEGYYDTPALYVPEGYRYVTQILIGFEENEELESQMEELQDEIDSLNEAEEPDTDEIEALQAEYDALFEEYSASAREKADEVLERLAAGESFEDLQAEFNEDEGSNEGGAYYETGYLVGPESTGYVEGFVTGAMTLENVGDVTTEAYESPYGYHILKLVSLVTPGAVPYEEVRDELEPLALAEKQNEAWNDQVEAWVAEADVVKNEERLADYGTVG